MKKLFLVVSLMCVSFVWAPSVKELMKNFEQDVSKVVTDVEQAVGMAAAPPRTKPPVAPKPGRKISGLQKQAKKKPVPLPRKKKQAAVAVMTNAEGARVKPALVPKPNIQLGQSAKKKGKNPVPAPRGAISYSKKVAQVLEKHREFINSVITEELFKMMIQGMSPEEIDELVETAIESRDGFQEEMKVSQATANKIILETALIELKVMKDPEMQNLTEEELDLLKEQAMKIILFNMFINGEISEHVMMEL